MEISEEKKIEYPTDWKYKIIGESEKAMQIAVLDIFQEKEYSIRFSHKSKKGKYLSLEISTTVQDEKERDTIFMKLKSDKAIKVVI